MQTKQELMEQIEWLETKAIVYAERLGSDSEEVRCIDNAIRELNSKILDLMMSES
jgi:hypothetical protein